MLTIDHIVLTVEDINKTISFYTDILGMNLVEFTPIGASKPRFALQFGNQKINIHQAQLPFKPHAKNPTCGSVDICFLSDVSIYSWIETFKKHSIIIEDGPIQRSGACGPIVSLYLRDPDGNLIEIANQN